MQDTPQSHVGFFPSKIMWFATLKGSSFHDRWITPCPISVYTRVLIARKLKSETRSYLDVEMRCSNNEEIRTQLISALYESHVRFSIGKMFMWCGKRSSHHHNDGTEKKISRRRSSAHIPDPDRACTSHILYGHAEKKVEKDEREKRLWREVAFARMTLPRPIESTFCAKNRS